MIDLDICPHTFRHSFATFAYSNGMSLDSVQKILGHNLYHKNTEMCIHKSSESLQEEYDTLVFFMIG